MHSFTNLLLLALFLAMTTTTTIAKRGNKVAFKPSLRCGAHKMWCFTLRFYEKDPQRSDDFLTPEIMACTNDAIFTTRMFGTLKNQGNDSEPYQLHFRISHNCTTIPNEGLRVIDLHYTDVPVETKRRHFRLKMDITNNGLLRKSENRNTESNK